MLKGLKRWFTRHRDLMRQIRILEADRDALQARFSLIEKSHERLERDNQRFNFYLRENTEAHVDVGVRDPSTVIMIGKYRNRGYIHVYRTPDDEFTHLLEHLNQLEREARIKTLDAPHNMRRFFDW